MRNPSLLGKSATSSNSKSTTTPCCSKVGIKRGPWTPEEDEVLANFIKREGEGRWRTLPKRAGLLRCGKSCRLRWMNYLRPSVKRGRIAPDEEDLILRLHRLLGNRWSLIAGRIPGRTDNEIKNYWNTHLSKKLISQGIDPRTHKPLNLTSHTSSQPNYDPVLKYSNPNPRISNSSELGEKTVIVTSKNGIHDHDFTPTNLEDQLVVDNGVVNWHNSESTANLIMGQPSSHGNGGGYLEHCNEDMFSSLLDSWINDNLFVNHQQHQQQHQQPNNVAGTSAQSFSPHGNIWEAQIMSSMVTFGNEQNSVTNYQQHQP